MGVLLVVSVIAQQAGNEAIALSASTVVIALGFGGSMRFYFAHKSDKKIMDELKEIKKILKEMSGGDYNDSTVSLHNRKIK